MTDAPPAIPDLPDHLEVVRGRDGVFVVPRRDTYIGRSLRETGEWCGAETDALRQLLRPGDWVVDGGANIGAHALAFARAVGPRGRVFAIEPQAGALQMLGMSALMSGLPQITPVSAALGDAPGTIRVPPINYGAANNFGGVSLAHFEAHAEAPGAVTVPVARLDDLLALPRLRLLKLDLQGAEAAALRGARDTIRRLRPFLCVEAESPEEVDVLLPVLAELGCTPHWLVCMLDRPGAPAPLFPGIASVNLLAAPEGARIEGLRRVESADQHPFRKPSEAVTQ